MATLFSLLFWRLSELSKMFSGVFRGVASDGGCGWSHPEPVQPPLWQWTGVVGRDSGLKLLLRASCCGLSFLTTQQLGPKMSVSRERGTETACSLWPCFQGSHSIHSALLCWQGSLRRLFSFRRTKNRPLFRGREISVVMLWEACVRKDVTWWPSLEKNSTQKALRTVTSTQLRAAVIVIMTCYCWDYHNNYYW